MAAEASLIKEIHELELGSWHKFLQFLIQLSLSFSNMIKRNFAFWYQYILKQYGDEKKEKNTPIASVMFDYIKSS